jgi:hypothetical protein
MSTAQTSARLAVPLDAQIWLTDRKARLADGLKRLAHAARNGRLQRVSGLAQPRVAAGWLRKYALLITADGQAHRGWGSYRGLTHGLVSRALGGLRAVRVPDTKIQ